MTFLILTPLSSNEGLQIIGWLLTVAGQVLVTARQRAGFAVWMLANAVLIALNLRVGLRWSALMLTTNLLCCIWSFWRWSREADGQEAGIQRRLFGGLAR